MRIVVTGGAGFVGSHIVDALVAHGNDVLVVDNLSTGRRKNVNPEAEFLLADVRNIEHALEGCDGIVHAAAYADLRRNWDSRDERHRAIAENVDVTDALLEAKLKRATHATLVFLSSSSVYGAAKDAAAVVEDEALSTTCESIYAAAKLGCEAIVHAHAHAHGFKWRIARLVNVVGARTTHGVIGDFVRKMRDTGRIQAADDGKQKKSWVHVLDVADAVARMLQADVANGAYAITSEERISWWSVVDRMGVPRELVTWAARDRGAIGDPHNLYVNGSKLWPYYKPHRSVLAGIDEALASLGWRKAVAA
jgi:UDP-glucose 4-epimerase